MFGKKFFSTVALGGAAVSLVGNVGSFAEEFGPHDSNIVLTCKDDTVDYKAYHRVSRKSYYYVNSINESWSVQDLVYFFRLDRSETEKLLDRMRHRPGWLHGKTIDPGLAQISIELVDDIILLKKRAKDESFGSWVYPVYFSEDCVDDMLRTDLDTIDFLNGNPEASKKKERPWRMYY